MRILRPGRKVRIAKATPQVAFVWYTALSSAQEMEASIYMKLVLLFHLNLSF